MQPHQRLTLLTRGLECMSILTYPQGAVNCLKTALPFLLPMPVALIPPHSFCFQLVRPVLEGSASQSPATISPQSPASRHISLYRRRQSDPANIVDTTRYVSPVRNSIEKSCDVARKSVLAGRRPMEWFELRPGVSLVPNESDFSFLLHRRSHQLPDGIEHDPELFVIFSFERIEFGR